jgi:tol-pal system protein YbgF
MKKVNWLRVRILFGIGVLFCGCATTKDAQILDQEIYRLELRIHSVQKEEDSLRDEFMAFQKKAQNDMSTLKKDLDSSVANLSALRKEVDLLKNDLTAEIKSAQTDLVIRFESLQSQVNMVQKEEESLGSEFSAFRKEVQNDIAVLKKEDHVLKSDFATETKKSRADFSLRFDALQSEIRGLSTGVDEYKESLKRPSGEIDLLRKDIASQIKALEERQRTQEERNRAQEDYAKAFEERISGVEDQYKDLDSQIGAMASKQVELEKALPAKGVPADLRASFAFAQSLYKDAYETFQRGDLERAREKFEIFLRQYSNTELSDNAHFWIGETYYQKRDFERAILEYEKVIVKYPESDKVPGALFKQALAFLELGDQTNAKSLLRRLIERYPHFDQVEMAKKKLESIK